ncbi:MAG: peptidyl-prolyl cis-trans isomerase [Deltaproteobacteria bacterium]|nr:peptidyl-prolyl cis-trans isomerase [Deltaproteobacteria bacterium]
MKSTRNPAGKTGARCKQTDILISRHYPFLAFVLSLSLFFVFAPQRAAARWPFAAKKPYLAKVGDIEITVDEFVGEVNKLHTTERVGKAISEEKTFVVQDYRKFLDELINNKLMASEAVRLGADKDHAFIDAIENYRLNFFLDRLKTDEVINKASVSDKEIEDYYNEELKKKAETALRAEPAPPKSGEKAGEAVVKAEKKEEAEKPRLPEPREKEAIRRAILARKTKEREKDYFEELKRRADIRVYDGVLKGISMTMEKPWSTAVSTVDGEPIYASEVIEEMGRAKNEDEEFKKSVVERLALHKLIDREARKRGRDYEKEPEIKKKVERFREERLIDLFKKTAVLPVVKVDEKEILEYYDANVARFVEPDRFNLRLILVKDKDMADSLKDELEKGADFGYLARGRSVDPSKEKGGEVGWVAANQFSMEIFQALKGAKPGDILGPFAGEYGYSIFQYHGMKKGEKIPLERVRDQIDRAIGREKFKKTLERYISRLRETVTIEINEEELKRFGEYKREGKD